MNWPHPLGRNIIVKESDEASAAGMEGPLERAPKGRRRVRGIRCAPALREGRTR